MTGIALSEDLIKHRAKCDDITKVVKLNLWGLEINNIEIIKRMPNLKVVSLTLNKVDTLEPFSYCPLIQEIYLRKNQIQSLAELQYLQKLPNLKVLWLLDNPCTQVEDYRTKVLSILPNLYKLDEDNVTSEERALVAKTNIGNDPVSKTLDFDEFEILEKNDQVSSQKNQNQNHTKNASKSNLKTNAMNVLSSNPPKLQKGKKANKWKMRRQESGSVVSENEKNQKSSSFEDQLEKLERGQQRPSDPILDVPMLRKSKTSVVDDSKEGSTDYKDEKRWGGKHKSSSGKSKKLKAIELLIQDLEIEELQELYNAL